MISVIIPACNEERYIEKTINSIKKQKCSKEVIIVCNGCTDNTYKIAKKYTKKVFIIKERNVSKARNYGAKKASGEILVFLDADTLLTPNSLNKISEALNSSVVIGTCKGRPDSKKIFYEVLLGIKNNLWWNYWVNGVLFCKKEVFDKVTGFDERKIVKEHRDLIKRAVNHGKFCLADTEVINSMRRFEKLGYNKVALFWLKNLFKNKEDYKIIR